MNNLTQYLATQKAERDEMQVRLDEDDWTDWAQDRSTLLTQADELASLVEAYAALRTLTPIQPVIPSRALDNLIAELTGEDDA